MKIILTEEIKRYIQKNKASSLIVDMIPQETNPG
ncbi:hypothetical protein HNQ80_003584 [Anaerosolibacter carboniphilus]|uniref:Uncharacterized protein n=2 Tax=Anaerosolibacter carboniphilus TaxID=1417629 RepID=A0A841KVQ4_9FIRM|nr:hypothetical protein [Anaerosolibacter carboniphilus]